MPSKSPPHPTRSSQPLRSRWRTEPGWLLLPLRCFLGATFTFAGLQKLANPGYLDPHNPTSVTHQMLMLQHSSPIGWLLGISAHAPTLVGLLIAFGELAVGLGTLAGLWTRAAAAGGALLSLTFFLTVSWNTTPYYYGSDIVFVFAWLVMIGFGAGGVFSVDAWLRGRARVDLGLAPEPAAATVAVPRLRALCPRGRDCGLAPAGVCTRQAGCPVFTNRELPPRQRRQLDRRTAVLAGAATGVAGALTLAFGGVTAAAGRLIGGTRTPIAAAAPTTGAPANPAASPATDAPPVTSAAAPPPTVRAPAPTTRASTPVPPVTSAAPTPTTSPPSGTAVAAASSVPVGQAASFTNPADGSPAWLVHPSRTGFVAFSAVCTHAGCTVEYDPSTVEFVCPCHGGIFDARTGRVLQGPPEAPLPTIPVHVVNGEVRAG